MNFHEILVGLDSAVVALVAAYGWFVLVGLVACVSFLYFRKHKQDVDFAEASLKMIQTALGNKLGSKSTIIFQLWIAGLEQIKNGNLSNQDILDDFINFVKLGAQAKAIALTEMDLVNIKVIAAQTLTLLKIKTGVTIEASKRFTFSE